MVLVEYYHVDESKDHWTVAPNKWQVLSHFHSVDVPEWRVLRSNTKPYEGYFELPSIKFLGFKYLDWTPKIYLFTGHRNRQIIPQSFLPALFFVGIGSLRLRPTRIKNGISGAKMHPRFNRDFPRYRVRHRLTHLLPGVRPTCQIPRLEQIEKPTGMCLLPDRSVLSVQVLYRWKDALQL